MVIKYLKINFIYINYYYYYLINYLDPSREDEFDKSDNSQGLNLIFFFQRVIMFCNQ